MLFTEARLKGAYLIDLVRIEDERGFFARSWCQREFADHGLNAQLVQIDVSWNDKRGTLRGLHYQAAPYQESKVVRCTRGRIYDVIVDMRPQSSTFRQWLGLELTARNGRALYVPEGFAHGFQTLVDETEVLYLMSGFYSPAAAGGLRWNDPALAIAWPEDVTIISNRDANYPDWNAK